jgi:hypothetical protein
VFDVLDATQAEADDLVAQVSTLRNLVAEVLGHK